MKKLTKKDFNKTYRLCSIVNDQIFNGKKIVVPEMISECDEYVFSKVKKAFPTNDQNPIIKAVYLEPGEVLFIIVQDCQVGISVSLVKKEVIDEYYQDLGSIS